MPAIRYANASISVARDADCAAKNSCSRNQRAGQTRIGGQSLVRCRHVDVRIQLHAGDADRRGATEDALRDRAIHPDYRLRRGALGEEVTDDFERRGARLHAVAHVESGVLPRSGSAYDDLVSSGHECASADDPHLGAQRERRGGDAAAYDVDRSACPTLRHGERRVDLPAGDLEAFVRLEDRELLKTDPPVHLVVAAVPEDQPAVGLRRLDERRAEAGGHREQAEQHGDHGHRTYDDGRARAGARAEVLQIHAGDGDCLLQYLADLPDEGANDRQASRSDRRRHPDGQSQPSRDPEGEPGVNPTHSGSGPRHARAVHSAATRARARSRRRSRRP